MAAAVSMRERDLLLMPASWTGGEAEDLVLCFPRGLQRYLSSTSWMQLVVWLLSPPGCVSSFQFRCLGQAAGVSVHCPRTQRDHLAPPGHSWVFRSQLCTLPGQGAAHLGFCLPQGSGVLRVVNQFLRCDKPCKQTLCDWEKLLLTFVPLTFHHRC